MLRLMLLIAFMLAAPAGAHFSEDTHMRDIVVDETGDRPGDGVMVYLRTPMPLVFADLIARSDALGIPLDHPVLYREDTAFGLRYRVSAAGIAAEAAAFGDRLESALTFRRAGTPVEVELVGFRLSPGRPEAPFDSAAAAIAALAQPSAEIDPVFGEAIVEYALRLPPGTGRLSVQTALPEMTLSTEIKIDNHLTRDTGARVLTATKPGQLTDPAAFPQGALAALGSFLVQGLVHIVTGFDHVFLVICFALGIGWSRQLLWVVTAFTLGHSVTLAMGATALVPQVSWFIPAVEAAIAASVVFAAVAAWQDRFDRQGGAAPIALAAGIGLIHGFGFASFLSDSLSPGTPAFAPALAGFNIGLEIGQIALVAVTLLVFSRIRRLAARTATVARAAVLVGIAGVSSFWLVERIAALIV